MSKTTRPALLRLGFLPCVNPRDPELRTFEVSLAGYLELCKDSDWLIARVVVKAGGYQVTAERVTEPEAPRLPYRDD